jgi:hypothetical protein
MMPLPAGSRLKEKPPSAAIGMNANVDQRVKFEAEIAP